MDNPLELPDTAKPQLKTQTKASKPKAPKAVASKAVVAESPKELVLKAKMRDLEQIARYQQLLKESQLTQTEFIIDRCLNTSGGNGEVPIINIQAYHELGQCRLVFETLIDQLKEIAGSDTAPLADLIAQLQQELAAIRATRKTVINLE